MAVGSYPVFAMGALAPFVIADLGISLAELGLVSTAVLLVGIVAAPVLGIVSDRMPGAYVSFAVLLLAALSLTAMAAAPSIWWLVGAASLYGLTSGGAVPISNRLLLERVPPGQRARLMGAKASGVQLGAMLSGLSLPSLALAAGWRSSLLVSAAIVGGGVVLALVVVPVSHQAPRATPHGPATTGRGSLVLRLAVYAVLMGFAVSALASFLVLYGVHDLGMSVVSAGLAAALLGGAGIVSRLVWTELSERSSGAYVALLLLPLGGVAGVLMVTAAGVGPEWLLWAGALVFGGTAVAWNAVGNLLLLAASPSKSGRHTGIMQSGFYTGYAIAPVTLGLLIDRTGSYAAAWGVVAATLCAASVWLVPAWLRDRVQRRPDGAGSAVAES
jgi:predicted MFS family arabinose efflux permease